MGPGRCFFAAFLGALGRSPGGAAAPPQRPQAAENRPQGGLGCALRLRFAATGIGKYWRSGAAGMGIETIRANFFEIGCQKNGGSFVKSSESGRNINTEKDGFYGDSTEFDRKLAG